MDSRPAAPGTCWRRYASSRSTSGVSPARTAAGWSIHSGREGSGGKVNAIPFQYLPGNQVLVDFVRAVVDPGRALVPVPVREHGVVGDSQRAVDLDRAVEHFVQGVRHVELDDGDGHP